MTTLDARSAEVVRHVVQTRLPTAYGEFTAHGYETVRAQANHETTHRTEHLALVYGEPTAEIETDVLVRVHSECLTGDVFGSLRCDCGPQLHAALHTVATAGTGVVVYVRGHEGRGIGLLAKLAAYTLQDSGHDTIDANLALGLPGDARDYTAAAAILIDLGIRRVRLLTNNPAKVAGLRRSGLVVSSSEPLVVPPNPENEGYLETKRLRLGHHLPAPNHRNPSPRHMSIRRCQRPHQTVEET
jgi:GTP cyclohydrolase II